MLRAFRYRCYPTPEQAVLLRRTIGCCRLVYNRALAMRVEAWALRQERVSHAQTDRALTAWKRLPELAFLNEVSAVALQQSIRHLDTAYGRFFRKISRHPVFHKKRNGGSTHYTRAGFRYLNGALTLAKMAAPLLIRWSRPLPVDVLPSSVTVSLDAAGRWHASILCEDASVRPLPPVDQTVGIDMGINRLATMSDGTHLANPHHFEAAYPKMRRAQRVLSRRLRARKARAAVLPRSLSKEERRVALGSARNIEKARIRVGRIHAYIADGRRDALHKFSMRLVRENQTICLEDLNVKGMLQNRKLARAISDTSWSELRRQLEYKCRWYGRTLVVVDRFFPSSKTCNACGHLLASLPWSVREWKCPACGTSHDRDVNAARNILAAGLAVSACGASVNPTPRRGGKVAAMKQEPSVAIRGIPVL